MQDSEPQKAPRRANNTVLIVDSDANHRVYAARLLQRFRYTVDTAASAGEAIDKIAAVLPAAVITDLDLPQMSGLDLLYRLQQEPRTSTIPVFALTLSGDHGTEARCLRAGFAACLTKPVGAEELYRSVEAVLDHVPRAGIRIRTRMPVTVNSVPLDCVEGECASVISENGMYVRTQRPHPPNSSVAVQIALKGRTIAADAVVLYNRQSGEGPFGEPGMGIKFSRITPQDREFLRKFILDEVAS